MSIHQGATLSLSLAWASTATAQRAADDFCRRRPREAAIGAGVAVEYAAKSVVAHHLGPPQLFVGGELSHAERWVGGDTTIWDERPSPEEIAAARVALVSRETIRAHRAIEMATKLVDEAQRQPVRRAAKIVADARNAAVHLGELDRPLDHVADALVTSVEALWG